MKPHAIKTRYTDVLLKPSKGTQAMELKGKLNFEYGGDGQNRTDKIRFCKSPSSLYSISLNHCFVTSLFPNRAKIDPFFKNLGLRLKQTRPSHVGLTEATMRPPSKLTPSLKKEAA